MMRLRQKFVSFEEELKNEFGYGALINFGGIGSYRKANMKESRLRDDALKKDYIQSYHPEQRKTLILSLVALT